VQAASGSCCEIYREKAFPDEWKPSSPLEGASWHRDHSVMLLVHPTIPSAQLQRTASVLAQVMALATKP
jgi:hypothetical protein